MKNKKWMRMAAVVAVGMMMVTGCGNSAGTAVQDTTQTTAQGGNCTVVDLPKEGITGNDHFLFQDLNNDVIADHVENWIQENVQ